MGVLFAGVLIIPERAELDTCSATKKLLARHLTGRVSGPLIFGNFHFGLRVGAQKRVPGSLEGLCKGRQCRISTAIGIQAKKGGSIRGCAESKGECKLAQSPIGSFNFFWKGFRAQAFGRVQVLGLRNISGCICGLASLILLCMQGFPHLRTWIQKLLN